MHFAYGRDVNHRELKGRLAVGLQSGPQCSLTHILFICMCVCVCVCVHLVTQLRLTLYNLMDCSPPGSSVHGDSPDKNTRVGCHALLQGIFPTQGSNPGLLHCRQIVYCLYTVNTIYCIIYIYIYICICIYGLPR